MLIEADCHRYLLDTGLSGKAMHNAARMGIDLTLIDALIFSHGHVDHTGGLEQFLQVNQQTPIYASEKIATYDYQSNQHGKPHSLSPNQQLIRQNSARFRFLRDDIKLSEHVWLVFCKHHDYACLEGTAIRQQTVSPILLTTRLP